MSPTQSIYNDLRPITAEEKQITRLDKTSAELNAATEVLYYLNQRLKNLKERMIGAAPEATSDKTPGHVEPPGHLNRIDSQINGMRLIIESSAKILEDIENYA